MSILRGHEDLQPKTVVGFEMGYALVQCAGEVKRYKLMIGPGGTLMGEPEPDTDEFPAVDQVGNGKVHDQRARRWGGIDQPLQ
jgi:hypothetical protein